jgi:hydrogenase-4 component F
VIHTLPWTGGLFLLAAFAITGMPPFGLFQSEFTALSAALAAEHNWSAGLFVLGVVVIFIGFLRHMAKMNLGAPEETSPRGSECPWKLGAMTLVAIAIIVVGFWLPVPIYNLVQESVRIITGGS